MLPLVLLYMLLYTFIAVLVSNPEAVSHISGRHVIFCSIVLLLVLILVDSFRFIYLFFMVVLSVRHLMIFV